MTDARLITRPAMAGDVPAIRAVIDAAYRPYLERMATPPAPMLDDYDELVARGVVRVAAPTEVEPGPATRPRTGAVVGVLVLWARADDAREYLYIDNIAVDPAAQGRGVGVLLLDLAAAEARAADLSELRLYTNEAMTENLAFYPRRGFTEHHRAVENGYHRVWFSKTVAADPPSTGAPRNCDAPRN